METTFYCPQRRCNYSVYGEHAPETCPACGSAIASELAPAQSENDWSDYTKAELLEAASDHDVEVSKSKNKAAIVAALEAAGVAPYDGE